MMTLFDWMTSYPGLTALAVGDAIVLLMFARWETRNVERLRRLSFGVDAVLQERLASAVDRAKAMQASMSCPAQCCTGLSSTRYAGMTRRSSCASRVRIG